MFTEIYDDLTSALQDTNLVELTNGADELNLTGTDTNIVNAKFGDDTVSGGEGTDIILGRIGDDTISGGAGDDLLVGGLGTDSLYGASGNDLLVGRTDDAMIAGGSGFDVLYIAAGDDDGFFDYVSQARGIEAIVGYGEEDVSARVSLSSIQGQSQDDGDSDTPDTDNTLIAVGLESLSLTGIRNFLSDEGSLDFEVEDLVGAEEQDYIELLNLDLFSELNLDLKAITFGTEENSVTIVTDLDLDDIITADGVSIDTEMDA
ncbi:hypothetical protein RCJ22_23850 [Vibrio sp. FNV 38]|nr:hypothetical protein [Vibrio sp. FNV 38]